MVKFPDMRIINTISSHPPINTPLAPLGHSTWVKETLSNLLADATSDTVRQVEKGASFTFTYEGPRHEVTSGHSQQEQQQQSYPLV